MLIMLIKKIAQHMQISIRQFLTPGHPHYPFPSKKFGVPKTSGLMVVLYSGGKPTSLLPERGYPEVVGTPNFFDGNG